MFKNNNIIKLFLYGVLSALAMPPLFIVPAILFLIYPLTKLYNQDIKTCFKSCWALFSGHFAASWYWICISLTLDIKTYFWLIPFALLALPMALAVIPASICLYNIRFRNANTIIISIAIASTIVISEIVRGVIFTGFPWTFIGYIVAFSDEMSQICSIFGIYGLSFIIIFCFSMLCFPGRNRYIAILCLSLTYGFGFMRLKDNPIKYTDKSMAIIQANIAQNLKWDPREKFAGFMKHIEMAKSISKPAHLVIFPESAIPYAIQEQGDKTGMKSYLAGVVGENSYLISGAVRSDGLYKEFWNTMFAFNAKGEVIDFYDKIHLLPFGEYVPLSKFIPMEKITHGAQDFSFGDENVRHLMLRYKDNHLRIMPLICYESVFSLHHKYNKHYDLIVNITNDAWFGNSSGPYQHFYMTKIRAIEYGLPLARAANSGISAIFDGYGRVITKLPLGESGIISSYIPEKIDENTMYNKSFSNQNQFLVYIYILIIISILNSRLNTKQSF